MATFYLDYVNGNDANDGSSWALAWKTFTTGATAARIAPGDIIRIAKSPDPTSLGITATWTNLSWVVTLASALTANIELCETAWIASANVTDANSTTAKEGTKARSLAIADAFTTGLIAYKTLASTDFSAYQQVSFWIRTNLAIAASTLTLRLCSDTAGVTAVNTIAIPAIPSANQYQVVTVDTGGALGAAIQSVALYAELDPGAATILIDDIIACKASSAADSLTLSSLISKSGTAQGGTEGFYGIKSINGTAVQLDNETNSLTGSGRGYSGTTETVTTYKRETIKTVVVALSSTVVQEVMDSGTIGNNIQFQGGWNTGTSLQDGETYFDGQNGFGYGVKIDAKSYITLNYLNTFRYYYGVSVYNLSNNITITTLSNANNNGSFGVICNTSNNNTITTLSNANNNGTSGVFCNTSNNITITTLSNANNNGSSGVYFNNSINNTITTLSNANNNGISGVYINTCNNITIKSLSTAGNTTAGVYIIAGINYLFNALIAEATEVTGITPYTNSRLWSNKHDRMADNHWGWTDGGTFNSLATDRSGGTGIMWLLTILSSTRYIAYPLDLVIARIACAASALVTVKAWMKKTHATNVVGQLVCRGGQIAGVASDVVATKADDLNTWEELTITFTPSEKGVVEITARGYYVAGNANVYVEDMTITQA